MQGDPELNLLIVGAFALVAILIVIALVWTSRTHGKSGELPSATFPPAPHAPLWSGWRRFKVRKRVDEDPAGQYVSFYLCPVNRRRLPAFEPGQHVQLRVEVPDPDHEGRMKDLIRTYYLSDSANGRYYRILVQRVSENGGLANYLVKHLQKGALVELTAPAGHCPFDLAEAKPLVLLGSGAGLAPMIALCNTLIDRKISRPIAFFYGMRNAEELLYLPNLEYAAGHLPDLRVELCFSETMPEGTVNGATSGDGVVYRKTGLGTAFLRKSLNLPEYRYYICGPGEALDTLAADLEALGVPGEQIHRASFAEAAPTTTGRTQ